MIAIDTETHLIAPSGKVRSERDVPLMVCYTWATDDGKGLGMWDADQGSFLELLEFAEENEETLVFHNAKFDLAVLSKWLPECESVLLRAVDEGRVLDTMCMYALRYPLKDKLRSLSAVVGHLFHKRMDKGSVRTSFRQEIMLSETQRRYAIEDAVATLAVALRLQEIPMGGLARDFDSEFVVDAWAGDQSLKGDAPDVLYSRAAAYLAWYLEPEGLQVNMEAVDTEYERLDREESDLCASLYKKGLMRPERRPGNPQVQDRCSPQFSRTWRVKSTDPLLMEHRAGNAKTGYYLEQIPGKWVMNTGEVIAAFAVFATDLGLTPPVTPTGAFSLGYDFWKEYRENMPDTLKDVLDLSKVRKYKSSFVGPLSHQRPARVCANYLIPGAETGRWACFRPNMQQQPKNLRHMYGVGVLGADYKSLECYTLAHCMAALGIRGAMLDTLRQGDIHTHVAEKVGVARQQAKAATFGLGGGMGERRFYSYLRYQCGLDVTYADSCRIRTAWLSYFQDVRQYLNLFRRDYYDLAPTWCSKRTWLADIAPREEDFDPDVDTWPSNFQLSKWLGGKITCILPSGRVVPKRNFSQAANMFFQGTGADVMTQAFVDMCAKRITTCAVVHDAAYSSNLTSGPGMVKCMHEALIKVCPTLGRDLCPIPEWEIQPTFF